MDARASASATTRLAASTRAGGARTAPARKVAPRLADSKRLDFATEPLSPPQAWLHDFLMKFLRDELRAELKRRGHSPTGLKEQLARRLVRDSDASAESIWQLAAVMTCGDRSRDHFPLEVLETEQALSQYLRETAVGNEDAVGLQPRRSQQ